MALLTVNERKAIFKQLGFGEYNEKSIMAFQKKYMLRKSDYDGVYGTNTDNTLRTVFYTLKYTKNFKPEEFRCECGGKYCCGYPSYMKPAELIHIQAIRDHWKKPVTVTCGLRCKTYNSKLGGSIQNSLHMSGLAIDFYQAGVTDTLANRKASIKWIKKQVNHHYTYGNGINSYGKSVSAPYMGNALHTDTNNNVKPVHPEWKESTPSTPAKPTTEPTPVKKTVDEIAKEIIDGKSDWGNGDTRKKKLTDAGYDYSAVQKRVNQILAGKKIADTALSYCGAKDKVVPAYEKAAKEVYGKGKDTYCHRFVGVVLAKCGYPVMNYKGKYAVAWKNILEYLEKNFTQVSGTPQAGDIHVTRSDKGAYHIFIELGGGKKAQANSKKKYYPHICKTGKGATNWLFRAK